MSVASIEASGFEPTQGGLDGDRPVSDLMRTIARAAPNEAWLPRGPSVSAFATVREAAHLMAARGLRELQVRNARGQIVGVLSTIDLYRWVAGTPREAVWEADDEGDA